MDTRYGSIDPFVTYNIQYDKTVCSCKCNKRGRREDIFPAASLI